MRIWVDADACPKVIKDILFRAADRTGVKTTLISNQSLRNPASPHIRSIQVPRGFDVADNRIVELLNPGDLVITADVPLAALVVAKGAVALNPRGDLYTEANIGEHLSARNLMEELRSTGAVSGGPPAFKQSDRLAFANQLDRLLAQKS